MTIEFITILISVVSALAAVISVIVARRANKTAEKIYSVEIIRQIFDIYRSDSMLKSLQISWKQYRKEWLALSGDDEYKAKKRTDSGLPIPYEAAENIVNGFLGEKENSREWVAFHEVSSFWEYIALLVSEDMIDEFHISTFTSPEILGFIYPFEVAYCKIKGIKLYSKTSLKALYEKYRARKIINPSK